MSLAEIKDLSSLAGQTIVCSCGHTHRIPIGSIHTGKDALGHLGNVLFPFTGQSVYLVGDENTMVLGRDKVRAHLDAAGCHVTEHTFLSPPGSHLVTDERLIGSMLVHMPKDTDLIIAIGSGTMNDTARVISARCNIPYIIVATAPSMDGYASVTSAVVMDGGKKSVPLTVPYGIIGDTDLIKTAPDHMLAAGAGDMLGKYTALRDWELAARDTGEYFCPVIAEMVRSAADRCAGHLPWLFDRDEETLWMMTDALILSGLAICMYGTSRPAAGLEHQIAHFWEVDAIRSHAGAHLHGNYVGLGALAACRLYEMAEEEWDLPGKEGFPSYGQMTEYIRILKGFCSPEVLGITPQTFREGILHAARPEMRYTLASFLAQMGRIDAYARRLTEEFF